VEHIFSFTLNKLLLNDYDYETLQTKLIYKIIRYTSKYSSISGDIFTFNMDISDGFGDTVVYRVGEIIAHGDTLWGNQVISILKYGNTTPLLTLTLPQMPMHLLTTFIYNNQGILIYNTNSVKTLNNLNIGDVNGLFEIRLTTTIGKELTNKILIVK
jgi:hypothetical protein